MEERQNIRKKETPFEKDKIVKENEKYGPYRGLRQKISPLGFRKLTGIGLANPSPGRKL